MTAVALYHDILAATCECAVLLWKPYVAMLMCCLTITFMHPDGLP